MSETLRLEVKTKALVFTSLAHFANDGAFFTMPLIIAIMTAEHIIPSLTIVMIPVAYYGGSLVLSVAVAALADRGARPGLLVGLGLAVISVGYLGLAASLSYVTGPALSAAVLASVFVTGLGTGFYHPIGAAILQLLYGDKNKGKALGVNGALGAVGRAIYPTIFFTIAAYSTNNVSIASVAAIGVAAAVVVSAGMRRTYLSTSGSAGPKDALALGSLRSRITKPLMILAVVAFVTSFANNGIASWMPTYLALQKGLGISSSLGFTLTLMYTAAIFGQPLIGYLVDRFEKRLVLAVSTLGSSLSILGYLFASGSLDVILLVILGFFTFSTFPIFLSLASDYVPRRSSSLSNALVWSLGANGGSIIGPLVVGAVTLSGIGSWSLAFELMAVAALVATSMIVLLRKPAARETLLPPISVRQGGDDVRAQAERARPCRGSLSSRIRVFQSRIHVLRQVAEAPARQSVAKVTSCDEVEITSINSNSKPRLA